MSKSKNVFRGYLATEKPRCSCGRFITADEPGHNRVVCSCGKPNTVWNDA